MSAYGHDDLDADEEAEIDRAYQRDLDDPRADAGYAPHPTLEPRLRARPTGGVTHWSFVEVDGPAPAPTSGTIGGAKVCRECRESAPVLHADPRTSHPQRVICGKCEGDINAERAYAHRRAP